MGKVSLITGQRSAPFGGQLIDLFEFPETTVFLHHGNFQVSRSIFLFHKLFNRTNNRSGHHGCMTCGFRHSCTQIFAEFLCRVLFGNRLIELVLRNGGTVDGHAHVGIGTRFFGQILSRIERKPRTDRAAKLFMMFGRTLDFVAQCLGGFFSTPECCCKTCL